MFKFTCICPPGFNGSMCQNNINDCPASNCSGKGYCIDGINSYFCNCTGKILIIYSFDNSNNVQ